MQMEVYMKKHIFTLSFLFVFAGVFAFAQNTPDSQKVAAARKAMNDVVSAMHQAEGYLGQPVPASGFTKVSGSDTGFQIYLNGNKDIFLFAEKGTVTGTCLGSSENSQDGANDFREFFTKVFKAENWKYSDQSDPKSNVYIYSNVGVYAAIMPPLQRNGKLFSSVMFANDMKKFQSMAEKL
jgi:hypothetical protein